MKLKSYFSATVESAVALARKELGEEALLVHARPSTLETRYLGAYEVVFGVIPASTAHALHSSEFVPVRSENQELDPELARKIAAGTQLNELISVNSAIGPRVALVGPPGVGKTTTLMKLAVRFGLAQHKSVHIITTDVRRIAAADQIRSLAAILGIGCDVAESPGTFSRFMEEQKSRDLILVDTPGFSLRELKQDSYEAAEVADALIGFDIHLVLSAAMKPADMVRIADAFDMFRPSKLLFTRLDETAKCGALVNETARRALPISFLTNGQEIPGDLEEATIERLSALVLGERPLLRKGAAA